MPGDITCARCGWRNEAIARMCGGCGQPLRQPSGAPATLAMPAGWAGGPEPGATTPVDISAPFNRTVALPAPGLYSPAPAHERAPSVWPGAAPAGQRANGKPPAKRKNPWRVPITLFVVLCVLLAAALGTWALVVRPAMHN
ncbi:MAG: hypothetical protein ACRDHP_14150, partial [Ktedonobacterales bacterium]